MKENHKKTIIFDMDGTLYEFKGDSFRSSGLYDIVIRNTLVYLADKLQKTTLESQEALNFILEKYGDSISVGLEKEFNMDRHAYFNFAWDVDVEKYVQANSEIKFFLFDLKKDFDLVLLSDAPQIWIKKVLKFIGIQEVFNGHIFSGEGDVRKEFGNAFEEMVKKINVKANDCIVVGDQEDTDIIPAKKVGMRTVYIGNSVSGIADYSIDSIFKLKNIIT